MGKTDGERKPIQSVNTMSTWGSTPLETSGGEYRTCQGSKELYLASNFHPLPAEGSSNRRVERGKRKPPIGGLQDLAEGQR